MKVFYARCSSQQQNEARQLKAAEEVGAEKIFIDKKSGRNTDRPALKEMLNFVREGDQIIISDLSRLGRNTKDLLTIVDNLTSRGIEIKSLKENIDTTTPQGRFVLSIFSALYEMELENIHARMMEGVEIAKAEGKYKGKPKKQIDRKEFERLCKEWRAGERTAVSIMKHFSISSQTFYRRVKEYNL